MISSYEDELDSVLEKFNDQIYEIAEKFRNTHIIPICRKHKLTFISGHGRYFFLDKKRTYENDLDFKETKRDLVLKKDLLPIFKILDLEIHRDDYLCYYVDCVRKEDYLK